MFQTKKLWIFHLLGWLLFISLPLTILSRERDPELEFTLLSSGYFWLFFLIYFLLFYLNLWILIPQFFLKQKHILYTGFFFIGITAVFFSQPFENLIFQRFHHQQQIPQTNRFPEPPPVNFHPEFPPPPSPERTAPAVDFVSLVLFFIVWIVSMAIKISEQWRLSEKKVIMSEADKAQAELSFFKAQINPHFLFNTLNNIYSLAVSQSEHTAPSILKLSGMMRYITEEATENDVPLEDEITCLENYIDLQKLRMNAKTSVEFTFTGNGHQTRIAPLILMTFVENAFKYGISNHHESTIVIRVEQTPRTVSLFCRNTIFDLNKENNRIGVGIANTRKRLDFLYPQRHELHIENDGKVFTVNLKLTSDEVHSH
ncbi:sensor histidine kinase [Dyadobacter flavalbus]|nr:sensor histidine kinase [Dyadobacter flavalbus]